jgi:hypothetical protein
MVQNEIYRRVPELEHFINQMKHEFSQLHRPPDQVIWDDVDLRDNLKVSQRTTAMWRQENIIPYSKVHGKIYYKLSDVLAFIEKYKIPAISETLKIKL